MTFDEPLALRFTMTTPVTRHDITAQAREIKEAPHTLYSRADFLQVERQMMLSHRWRVRRFRKPHRHAAAYADVADASRLIQARASSQHTPFAATRFLGAPRFLRHAFDIHDIAWGGRFSTMPPLRAHFSSITYRPARHFSTMSHGERPSFP